MLRDGCQYQLVSARLGGGQLDDLSDACIDVQWDRKDSTTTVATATLAKRAGNNQRTITGGVVTADCCSKIAVLATIAQEFEVRRGGDVVWAGPLSVIDEGRDNVKLRALDESVWIRDWRTVPTPYNAPKDVNGSPTRDLDGVWHDVAALAAGSGTGLMIPAGTFIGTNAARSILPGKRTAGSDIDEITRTGRVWTMLGRTITFDAATLPPLTLDEDDFLTELRVVENGEQWASRVWLNGNGDIQAVAGGANSLGIVKDVIVNETTIMDQASAVSAAQRRWQAGGGDQPVPTVVVPSGAELAETALVNMVDLVPGRPVTVRLASFCTNKTSLAAFTLADVAVKVTGRAGGVDELVSITLNVTTATDQA